MRLYTVITLADITGVVSWRHINGRTALDAMTKMAEEAGGSRDIQIIGALAGKHELECPTDEARTGSSYASDLVQIRHKGAA